MSCCSYLTTFASERATYFIGAEFLDESGNAVTPKSASWTLTDLEGNVINGRQHEAISSLASSVTIKLQGDDLAISASETRRQVNGCSVVPRMILVEYVYDSSKATDALGKMQQGFFVQDLVGVS